MCPFLQGWEWRRTSFPWTTFCSLTKDWLAEQSALSPDLDFQRSQAILGTFRRLVNAAKKHANAVVFCGGCLEFWCPTSPNVPDYPNSLYGRTGLYREKIVKLRLCASNSLMNTVNFTVFPSHSIICFSNILTNTPWTSGVPSTSLTQVALTRISLTWVNVNLDLSLKPFH